MISSVVVASVVVASVVVASSVSSSSIGSSSAPTVEVTLITKLPKKLLTFRQKLIGGLLVDSNSNSVVVAGCSIIEISGSFSPIAKENLILAERNSFSVSSSKVGISWALTKLFRKLFFILSKSPAP